MICLQESNGYLQVANPQPVDLTSCVMVAPSSSEVVGANSPFNLSATDGVTIAYAIVMVWGVGFAGRALIKSLKGDIHEDD